MINKKYKYILVFPALVFFLCLLFFYSRTFGKNIRPKGNMAVILIPDGASYSLVMDSLSAHLEIRNMKMLKRVSEIKGFPSAIKSGRYVFDRAVSYNTLINILKGGRQSPVLVTFNNIRTLNDLAGRVGHRIEADSASIISFLSDPENYTKDGFTPEDVISVFIPNTYELYWNTGAGGFYRRMLREYRKFWTPERLEKAKLINLTPVEVSILASIVQEEALKDDEKPKIAGVYLNRLRLGIPLQADPTIKFAVNDFTLTRVLKKYLTIDSPYNTYKYSGLPPGPINCPTIESMEAVLNAEKHDYLFFAARADFSGYHNFSRTLAEHSKYAAQYQRELNRRRIFR